jgi:hypothetical protein
VTNVTLGRVPASASAKNWSMVRTKGNIRDPQHSAIGRFVKYSAAGTLARARCSKIVGELYWPRSSGCRLPFSPSEVAEYRYWRFGNVGPSSDA